MTKWALIVERILEMDSLRGRGASAAAIVGIGDPKPCDLLWGINQILDHENHRSALP